MNLFISVPPLENSPSVGDHSDPVTAINFVDLFSYYPSLIASGNRFNVSVRTLTYFLHPFKHVNIQSVISGTVTFMTVLTVSFTLLHMLQNLKPQKCELSSYLKNASYRLDPGSCTF